MNLVYRILIAVALIAVLGWFVARTHQCSLAGISIDQAMTSSDLVYSPELVYPTTAVQSQLGLGYKIYNKDRDGHMVAVPLPPGMPFATLLQLSPGSHQQLVAELDNAKCAAPVDITVYRPDRAEALAHTALSAGAGSMTSTIDVALAGSSKPLLVEIRMAAGAKNSWYCNVSLRWN